MAPPPPPLVEDLIAEVLLRLPPDEPAHLARAALVCKPWCRLISEPAFRRRYRAFHGTPPTLGYLHNLHEDGDSICRFVPTTDASPFSPPPLALDGWWAIDCRHGRVLIHGFTLTEELFVVWDPVTNDQDHFPLPNYPRTHLTGAVLCAVDGCDHLDCHDGPFLVVFVGSEEGEESQTLVSVFSTETDTWISMTSIDVGFEDATSSLLVGDALYFTFEHGNKMLKFDLGDQSLSVIPGVGQSPIGGMAVTAEGGGLGFTAVLDNSLHLWSWHADAEGTGGWKQYRVIKLEPLLPNPDPSYANKVIGFAEGTDTIFINTKTGLFALELKSGHVRKVGEQGLYYDIIPYKSFYTPDFAMDSLSSP